MGCTTSTLVDAKVQSAATRDAFDIGVKRTHAAIILGSDTGGIKSPEVWGEKGEVLEGASRYQLQCRVGSGSFATVYAARDKRTGEKCAVKVLARHGKDKEATLDVANKNELVLMKKVVPSKYCVGAKDSYEDARNSYIVMDLCYMALPKCLLSKNITENELIFMFRDMLLALSHIHKVGIAHRDVKPDNFLCEAREGGFPDRVRLADYGLARALPPCGYFTGTCGTAPFMPPEMIREEQYTRKADVWAFGAIAYTLLFGRYPYMPATLSSSAMKQEIKENKKVLPYFHTNPTLQPSGVMIQFLRNILCQDPTERPSSAVAVQLLLDCSSRGGRFSTELLRPNFEQAQMIGAFQPQAAAPALTLNTLPVSDSLEREFTTTTTASTRDSFGTRAGRRSPATIASANSSPTDAGSPWGRGFGALQ